MSREVRIVELPDLPPHRCSKCLAGGTARNFFVDLGFETEFDGVVYLCEVCFKDIGSSSKLFITHEDHVIELAALEQIRSDYFTLQAKLGLWNAIFMKLTGNDLYDFFDSVEKVVENGSEFTEDIGTVESEPVVDEQTLDSANIHVGIGLNFS